MTRLRIFLIWFLALGVAAASLRLLALPVATAMPNMAHYLPAVPLAFWAHVAGASLALAILPFQFRQGLRARRRGLHRLMGRAYALAILAGSLGALAFLPHFKGSLWAATGFGLLAVLWMGATARAVWLARAGRLADHRRWMIRSAALTFAAVTLRLIMPVLIAGGWGVAESYDITGWACWVPNLIVAEWWLRRKSERAPEGALAV